MLKEEDEVPLLSTSHAKGGGAHLPAVPLDVSGAASSVCSHAGAQLLRDKLGVHSSLPHPECVPGVS